MILQSSTNTEISGDDFESIKSKINVKNQKKLFRVLSEHMYRRPIPSIVREITSNSFDSHIEANVDDPVIIVLKEDEGGDYILFKDVGIGMSPERIQIYSELLSSTKELTNDQHGTWGLGSKSPFAYTNSFFLTTVYNKIKYEFSISKSIDGFTVDKLIEDSTEERNGTEIKIYIKNSVDVNLFIQACKSELTYFDNVYFDSYYEFNNEYSILEYNTFKYRPDYQYDKKLHIILGKVSYPISWEELGIDIIFIPVGLKFKIGDLQITPERESIQYIDIIQEDGIAISTKQVILNKIADFKKEIQELHEKHIDNIFDDYSKYLIYQEQKECKVKLDEDIYLDVSQLIKKPEGIFEPLQNFQGKLPKNLFFEYRTNYLYQKKGKNKEWFVEVTYQKLNQNLHLIPSKSGKLNRKKLEYLFDKAKDLTGNSTFFLVEKIKDEKKSALKQVLNYLEIKVKSNLYDYSKTNATKQLKLYRDFVEKEFKRLTYSIDDIQIDQEWLKEYNEKNKRVVNKEENSFLVYNYGGSTLAEKEYKSVEELRKFTGFIIFGTEENEDLIRDFRILLMNSKYGNNSGDYIDHRQCKLYKTAQRNFKYFQELKNAIYIEQFMGNNKIFKRFATAALIEDSSKAIRLTGIQDINRSENKFQKIMEEIFPSVADTLKDIEKACDEFGRASYTRVDNKVSDQFFKDLVEVARDHNLYDKDMIDAHNKLERYVVGLDLINYIACDKEEILPYLVDFLKLKNKKVDQIWDSQEVYEQQLIQDSLERISYLLSIYSHSEYYCNHEYIPRGNKAPISQLSDIERKKKIINLQRTKTIYQGLLKYQQYGKTN